jgi:hypothetical protein
MCTVYVDTKFHMPSSSGSLYCHQTGSWRNRSHGRNIVTLHSTQHYYTTKTLITNKCTKTVLPSVYWRRDCLWSRLALQAGTTDSSRLQKQRSTQSTAHSHSNVKCNLSVTVTKSSPWRWPSRVETCRSVLQLIIKLALCICWWLVFLYNILHGHGTH